MVSSVSSFVYYGVDALGQTLGLSGMEAGDTIATAIIPQKVLDASNASATFPGVVDGVLSAIEVSGKGTGDSLDNNVSSNSIFVYDDTLKRVVSQLAPFIAAAGGGGPFSNPNVVINNSTVSRVDLTSNLSAGPGTTAYFDGDVNISGSLGVSGDTTVSGNLGVSGNTDIRGDLFVSGDTVLSGTLLVSGSTAIGQDPGDPDFIVNDPLGSVVRIDTYGGANKDSELNFRENAVDRGTIKWDGGDNDFIWNSTAGDIRINPTGNVGINDDTPDEKLHVGGNIKVDGTLVVSSQNSVATMTGALPTMGTLIAPTPPGAFSFLSAVGDGTATTAEVSFGAGTEIQGVSSVGNRNSSENAGYYLWDAANNELEVSSDGVYKVEFVGVVGVAAAMDITISMYTGATLVHRYDLRVHSVTDPHNLVSAWVGFVRTTEPISVTINGGAGSDNAQLLQGSTVFVQRLA